MTRLANSPASTILQQTTLVGRLKHPIALLALILLTSFILNFSNNDFPLEYHADESGKTKFILGGEAYYKHPLLMIRVNQLVNLLTRFTSPQDVAVLGRTVSAVFGVLVVVGTFLFSAMIIGHYRALLVALAVAVSPIVVVHSHYLKEDIILTACCCATLYACLRLIESCTSKNTILLGICAGFAFSAKYVAVLFVPLFLLVPLLAKLENKKAVYRSIGIALAIACGLFLLINHTLLFEFAKFQSGISYEVEHVTSGHTGIAISPLEYFFCFHLLHSIVPSITWFVTVPAIFYIIVSLVGWKRTCRKDKVLVAYVLLFYFVVESSPMKSYPGYVRYVAPMIPVLCYFAFHGVLRLVRYVGKTNREGRYAAVLFCLCLLYPMYDSAMLVYYMNRDTRAELAHFLQENPGISYGEQYSKLGRETRFLASLRNKAKLPPDTKYLLASSFVYQRFLNAAKRNNPSGRIKKRARFYHALFEHTHIVFEPRHRSYAFTNPVIRVIEVPELVREGVFDSPELRLRFKSD